VKVGPEVKSAQQQREKEDSRADRLLDGDNSDQGQLSNEDP
jgi:hypothetical protein